MLIGTAWLSRLSVDTPYVTGIALAMVVFGVGQGFGLSTLTNAGMAGVAPHEAGAAGGVINAAHHLGGAVESASSPPCSPRPAHRPTAHAISSPTRSPPP